jgi:F-box protein 21
MRVDKLDRGRHQPFYTSFVLDSGNTQRCMLIHFYTCYGIQYTYTYFLCTDVAEENIEPVLLSVDYIAQFFDNHSNMFMYFQSIELEEIEEPKQEKRWRMVLSPEMRFSFPEDEMIGSTWVKEGIFPHLRDGL